MISRKQLEVLRDIFGNTEREDKITLSMDNTTRNITVVYEDLDYEWFMELLGLREFLGLDKAMPASAAGTGSPAE